MIAFIKRFFRPGPPKQDDIAGLSREINPLIETVVWSVFRTHYTRLLNEDATFIVYAVWGAKENGELNEVQRDINDIVTPTIQSILRHFGSGTCTAQQQYATAYLVRTVIIMRLLYMCESMKIRIAGEKGADRAPGGYGIVDDDFFKKFSLSDEPPRFRRFGDDSVTGW